MQLARTEQQIALPTSWSALPMGDWVAAELQERLDNWCPHLFGYHLLKIGALSAELSCGCSTIRHQIGVAPGGRLLDIQGDPLALPVRSGSVDACLLAHCLDFSPDPHQVLREAERVLTDDGWLIVSGYNPLSLVGLGHYLPFMRRHLPWSARMFTPARVTDWLQLLGCEVMFDERFGFSFMGRQSKIGWWRESLGRDYCRSLASVYVIAARKRRFPVPPVRRRWRRPEAMAAPGMARQGGERAAGLGAAVFSKLLAAGGLTGKLVTAFVFRVARVSFHPEPFDLVTGHFRIQGLPEIDVLDRLTVGGHPALLLPADDPLGDPLAHILAVGGEPHLAGFVQGPQPHDGSHQLHPVIGGQSKTCGDLLAMLAIDHDGTIAAGARVA